MPSSSPSSSLSSLTSYLSALSWYCIFGLIHELSHVLTACALAAISNHVPYDHDDVWRSLKLNWVDVLFHRRFQLQLDPLLLEQEDSSSNSSSSNSSSSSDLERNAFIIRQSGWIASVFVAFVVTILSHRRRSPRRHGDDGNGNGDGDGDGGKVWCLRWCQLAACITALDAVWTDLLQMNPLFDSNTSSTDTDTDTNTDTNTNTAFNPYTITFFCGNFGVILLHSAWIDDNGGKSALGILKKMIEVTMMRGAQSGGIVTFKSKMKDDDDNDDDDMNNIKMKSIRSRVVKSKRGDLSKALIAKLKRDAFSPFSNLCSKKRVDDINLSRRSVIDNHINASIGHNVRFFAGHTRFATSSMANLDGTHPHQWTPPTKRRRVYNFLTSGIPTNLQQQTNNNQSNIDLSGRRFHRCFVPDKPENIFIENFITHNGDYEQFHLNGANYDIDTIQEWLAIATGSKIPTVVDSVAIAGMVDLIRCKGCFALSCRYVICLGLPTSKISTMKEWLPSDTHYHKMGLLFEEALSEFQATNPINLNVIDADDSYREALARKTADKINQHTNRTLMNAFAHHVGNAEEGFSTYNFAKATVDAFFDNDLFNTVKIFMKSASGSFGLCVMSSLDAHRQMCLAARGQSISIAFYPQKRMICYGSEQAAVKAGMLFKFPGSSRDDDLGNTHLDIDDDVQRLDLDDVGGEICLIDWSGNENPISRPNHNIQPRRVMYNKVALYLLQECNNLSQPQHLHHRMTKLTNNRLILPLKEDCSDPILQDLHDIPKICKEIQDNWRNVRHDEMFSLNRLTAVNLGRCMKQKLEGYASGAIHRSHNRVDILLTGCEVSLWLAENFASDLQKAFPNLRVHCASSNKLLGLFGQENISVPSIGFPYGENNLQFDDAIMIVVSHSGGTFGPLSCSSLFQSMTKNIFVITSEWDTQIGKQLRLMCQHSEGYESLFNSHIFTTGVGIRPAEPCSLSVVATHQLLTNIFQYISIVILSDEKYRQLTGAIVTENDLQILEKCNRDNVYALEEIVGVDTTGKRFKSEREKELRQSGDIWSEHVLENAKAYIMTFIYIFTTVISGFPIVSGIARLLGFPSSSNFAYLRSFCDAVIYFFLPQINIIIIRLVQKRPLRHRMVGRTVVIGDIPWVAQAAEAFLSKIFACSYSIAGLNVHSANPSDHLVHRMTHRVVRGTLFICGRPDGRLAALTAAENAVTLSINQANSIQSLGSTCETVTIGHNEFKLPLTERAIFLSRHRPLFLCEYLLAERDEDGVRARDSIPIGASSRHGHSLEEYIHHARPPALRIRQSEDTLLESIGNVTLPDGGKKARKSRLKSPEIRTSAALLGQYKSIEKDMIQKLKQNHFVDGSEMSLNTCEVINMAIQEKKWLTKARRLFETLNIDKDGQLKQNEFVEGLSTLGCDKTNDELLNLFLRFEHEGKGYLYFDDFFHVMSMHKIEVEHVLQPCIRDSRGLVQVGASEERFFGEMLIKKSNSSTNEGDHNNISVSIGAMKSQNFSQELYESRIASMQRFVAMTVLFHQMGSRVQNFFVNISLGLLGYRMDRSHSIMRIATTASPISGAEIRDTAKIIFYMKKIRLSINIISCAWLDYKERKDSKEELRAIYRELKMKKTVSN